MSDVYRVTNHGEFVVKAAFKDASDNAPEMKSDTSIQRGITLYLPTVFPVIELIHQSDGTRQCPIGIIDFRRRLAEYCHHAVSNKLINGPAMFENRLGNQMSILGQQQGKFAC